MPTLTLGLVLSGVFLRLTRINVIETNQEEYVAAAWARGIKNQGTITRRYALKNTMIPVITLIGLQVAILLAGAVLTERCSPGRGWGATSSSGSLPRLHRGAKRDRFFALFVAVISLAVDILYSLLDPRGALLMPDPVLTELPSDEQWQADLGQVGLFRRVLNGRKWYGVDWWMVVISSAMVVFFIVIAFFPGLLATYDPLEQVGPRFLPPGETPDAEVLILRSDSPFESLDDLAGLGRVPTAVVQGAPSSEDVRSEADRDLG